MISLFIIWGAVCTLTGFIAGATMERRYYEKRPRL